LDKMESKKQTTKNREGDYEEDYYGEEREEEE
jgi:hypothetical protein